VILRHCLICFHDILSCHFAVFCLRSVDSILVWISLVYPLESMLAEWSGWFGKLVYVVWISRLCVSCHPGWNMVCVSYCSAYDCHCFGSNTSRASATCSCEGVTWDFGYNELSCLSDGPPWRILWLFLGYLFCFWLVCVTCNQKIVHNIWLHRRVKWRLMTSSTLL
jgi:hypothetical protein